MLVRALSINSMPELLRAVAYRVARSVRSFGWPRAASLYACSSNCAARRMLRATRSRVLLQARSARQLPVPIATRVLRSRRARMRQ